MVRRKHLTETTESFLDMGNNFRDNTLLFSVFSQGVSQLIQKTEHELMAYITAESMKHCLNMIKLNVKIKLFINNYGLFRI